MKRVLDLVLSLIAIILLAMPIIVLALMVRLTSEGPVIYWSTRVGKKGEMFQMPKFRSMRIDAPVVATHLLKNPNEWLTPIGPYLRKMSLDELPQLWCILKGEMSFVGPRPALYNQYDLIKLRKQFGVDVVLPGLTGLAQINGRDALQISDKVGYDVEYVAKKSLSLDLYILWRTLVQVLTKDGVSH